MTEIPADLVEAEILGEYSFGPFEIARNLEILGIEHREIYLFFYGKIYEFLELPPLWEKRYDPVDNVDFYIFDEIEFSVHPCYFYIKK